MFDFLIHNNRDSQIKIISELRKLRFVFVNNKDNFINSCNNFIYFWLNKEVKNSIIFISEPNFTSLAGPLDLEIYCQGYDYVFEDNFLMLSCNIINKYKSIKLDAESLSRHGFRTKTTPSR